MEAALEASGLLDAWISASEGITLPGHDMRVEAALAAPVPGPSLLDVLQPEEDIPVPTGTVIRILGGIGYGTTLPAGPAAISADGAWRLATATGTWAKLEPTHIGAVTRERSRQGAIAVLEARVVDTDASLAALDDRLRELAARAAHLEADLASRPDHREIDACRRAWDGAEQAVAARDDAVRYATGHLARRETEVTAALRALRHRAAEHGLPTDRARLAALLEGAETFRELADTWVYAHLTARSAVERAGVTAARADRSYGTAEDRAGEAAADKGAAGTVARLAAVAATVGEDYRQIVARVTAARAERDRCRADARAATGLLVDLEGRIGELRATSGEDADRRGKAVALRDGAAHRLRHLCLAGLAEDAGFTSELAAGEGTKATLEVARAIAARWRGVPHAAHPLGDAAHRLSEAVHDARGRLGVRADLDLEPDDDIQLFTASLDGVRVGATGLLTAPTGQRDRSRDDISTAEHRLFDQILTGDIRRHLAARIRRVGELVGRMNGHLERVRTASKVAVQLVWDVRPDLPDSTPSARRLLLKDPGRVTESDREALHAFFRARIEEAKGSDTAAS